MYDWVELARFMVLTSERGRSRDEGQSPPPPPSPLPAVNVIVCDPVGPLPLAYVTFIVSVQFSCEPQPHAECVLLQRVCIFYEWLCGFLVRFAF